MKACVCEWTEVMAKDRGVTKKVGGKRGAWRECPHTVAWREEEQVLGKVEELS